MTADKIVTVNVGGEIFVTHKSTLVCASSYFRQMYSMNPEKEDQTIFLDHNPKIFGILLDIWRSYPTPKFEAEKLMMIQHVNDVLGGGPIVEDATSWYLDHAGAKIKSISNFIKPYLMGSKKLDIVGGKIVGSYENGYIEIRAKIILDKFDRKQKIYIDNDDLPKELQAPPAICRGMLSDATPVFSPNGPYVNGRTKYTGYAIIGIRFITAKPDLIYVILEQ